MRTKPFTAQWEKERADYWFAAYSRMADERTAALKDARMWRDRFFRAMRQLRKVRA
jgi:hypothetical protein